MDSRLENPVPTPPTPPESEHVHRANRAAKSVVLDDGDLPWGYGEDRITAIVRDPDSAYLYWEITDDGLAAARSRLGPGGDRGWCNLRIYDATGRDFNGTNANDYFDLTVDRADREQYLMIRRPTSSMYAEIGVKTEEGYFQPIARSGRAEFPRNRPSPNTALEWMTITSDGAPPCAAPYRSRYAGPEPPLPDRAGAGYVDAWRAGYAPGTTGTTETDAPQASSPWSTRQTLDRSVHVERWWRLDEWRAEWRSGLRFLRWQHFDPERVAVELLGETPTLVQVEGGELVIYGPWRIAIQAFEGERGRRVLSTWSMHWVRATTPLIERWERVFGHRIVSGWERGHVFVGASEAYALPERGASELLTLGGSERMWLGASEWLAGGASETAYLGASETAFLGASGRFAASVTSSWGGGASGGPGAGGASGGPGAGGASGGPGASGQPEANVASGHRGETWGGRLEEKGP